MRSDLIVQTVNFGEDIVQISYVEMREQSKNVGIARSMVIAIEEVRDDIEDVISTLEDIIDQGNVMIRNPPKVVKDVESRTGAETADDSADA